MPITTKDAPDVLPAHGKDIFVAAFNNAYAGTCKERDDRDACASKIAWSAIKEKYKKVGDDWVARAALAEVELVITKASLHSDGTMRWQGVASDTSNDLAQDHTTMALFHDWIERAEGGVEVGFLPPPRQPFLGISHYPSLDGFGEAGVVDKMYIDGNRFKVGGQFNDTPVGRALFEAVRAELDLVKRGETPEKPIRISAAWWDIQHAHGDFKFTRQSLADICPMCAEGHPRAFLKGQLDHFASTRVPLNPRTSLGLEEKSMAKRITRRDDAASILPDDLADELEERAQEELVGKSETETSPALVIKADGDNDGEIERAKMKTVDGKKYPAGDFLVVEDPDKPSTWHLQFARNGKPDHGLMGSAWAALHKGFRGKKYEGPDRAKALRKLKGVYKKEDMELPTEKALVEMFGPEAVEPAYWRPYGGATSLTAAEDYLATQELEWQVQDNWSMLRAVMDNILDNDDEDFDRIGAIRQAVTEFGDRVAALKANISDAYLFQPAIKGAVIMDEKETTPVEEPTAPTQEAPPTPEPTAAPAVVNPAEAFWTDVQATLKSGGTREQMLTEVQGALEQLATAAQGHIDAIRPPDMTEEVKAAVEKAIQAHVAPLAEKLELLLVKQQAPPAPQVPQQKSVTVPTAMPQVQPVSKSALTQMIRRSVGLND